jgi:UDP-GlcNAc:undecaprenyl-phosphate GlcNAc-1-phosphate transferase
MTEVSWWEYAVVFLTTLGLTLLATPLALNLAVRKGILDHPGLRKAQTKAVPYLGGVAITFSFTAAILAAAMVRPPHSGLAELVAILASALVLAVLGLLDDLYGLGPFMRLAVETAAGVVVWLLAEPVRVTGDELVDLLLTVLWIVGVTNAFNMLDNMDGLSAGTAAIAAVSIFALAAANGQFLVATFAIALVGCCLGFLRSNRHPARIYMGDAGSLFIGFLLAVLAAKLRFDAPPDVALFVPVVLLGVPLFDMVLVTVNRVVHGRNPLSGGRDHTSHRLVFVGLPVPVAVGLILGVAASAGWIALLLAGLDRASAYMLVGWIAIVATGAGILLSAVPVYETSTRRHLMIQDAKKHEPEPPTGST